jgi:hypothetical protein
MINKETFCDVICKIQQYEKFLDRVGEYVMLEKFPEVFNLGEITDMLFKEFMTIEQVDEVNAWLYENNGLDASYEEIRDFYDELFGSMAK